MTLTEQELETINRALWRWGPAAQEVKAIEELAELQRALARVVNAATLSSMVELTRAVDNVFEEIADVEIMLAQIRLIFASAPEEIDRWKRQKLARLKERLEHE